MVWTPSSPTRAQGSSPPQQPTEHLPALRPGLPATRGGGEDSRAPLLSLSLTLALIPSLAALRSENSWAPGDKDQSFRAVCVCVCVCAQEKGEGIQQFHPWGKRECHPSHTHHKVDQTASLEKRRKKEGGCKQKCPFLFFFIGGGAGYRATPSEQHNCCNVACNNSYSSADHSY